MRKNRKTGIQNEFSILTVDDDEIMTLTLQSYFQAAGFHVDVENNPNQAIERVRNGNYDILLLDFLMRPICGDEVVRQIREFDKDLFIILLTGHKSMAPPVKTVQELDIQGYYEKSDRFDQLELLIASCVKSIRQMRIIKSYRDGLKSILDTVPSLCHQKDFLQVLEEILNQLGQLLPCSGSYVFIDTSVLGTPASIENSRPVYYKGTGAYGQREKEAEHCYQENYKNNPMAGTCQKERQLSAPLSSENGQCFGILFGEFPEEIKHEYVQLFEVYANQISAVTSNFFFRYLLQIQNSELENANNTLRQNYLEIINAMRQMVDAKDIYTRGHSDRVSYYAVLIAHTMNKDKDYIERLKVAGLFHDIGKMGIHDSILGKTGPLTDEEFEQIKTHPTLGRKVLSSLSSFSEILPIVEAHHERYEGGGYPKGIKGEEIPEEARIISVADAFDAMTSKRTYRESLTLPEAIKELETGKGGQFDPCIVDAFLESIHDFESIKKQLLWTFPQTILGEK